MHTFSCEECAKVFTTEIELKTHANCTHDVRIQRAETTDSPNFPCTFCEKMFKAETELTMHIEQVHKCSCEECSKVFATENELKTHVNSIHDVRNKRFRGDTS